ncbi:MAG: hypothetical protein RL160_386 [Bacteroidota bacterium]
MFQARAEKAAQETHAFTTTTIPQPLLHCIDLCEVLAPLNIQGCTLLFFYRKVSG